MALLSTALSVAAASLVVTILWLYRINKAMAAVPEAARKASPNRWTSQGIRDTYERVKKTPANFAKHMPPRLDRRYIVTGGSGMVGGDIVMQLLERGQSPESIRILDFAPLNRQDMLDKASGCDYVKTDISSTASLETAFSKPWPKSVAKNPLTVFHTAAKIVPGERNPILYHRVHRVNVVGTANVVDAAKKAGADIFVATSSASTALLPVNFWIWPWQSSPKNYTQAINESDFDLPLRPHSDFFANYALTKARAERLVCGANEDGFRTGTIRPGNGIYGQKSDLVLSAYLKAGMDNLTWILQVIQNFVNSRNVALAHLLFEAALAREKMPPCAGRPFMVTDPGPPIAFSDMYKAADELSETPTKVTSVPPGLFLLLAHFIEAWCLAVVRFPFLTTIFGIKEPAFPLNMLQPAVICVSANVIIDDSAIRKSVEDGGLGYRGGCTTLEGVCEQLADWNRENGQGDATSAGKSISTKIESLASTAKTVAA